MVLSPALSLERLSFAFTGGPPVLRDVMLDVPAGSLLCLLGPNGSGKTTLLRLALGLLRGRGRVRVGGEILDSLSAGQRASRVAYVPQRGSVVFAYTIADVAVMGCTPRLGPFGVPGAADHELARACLDRLGIAHLAARPFNEASGGEQQLALIARAMVQDAPLLLLDEPTASLDLANEARVLDSLADLVREGRTVVMTTHDPDQALSHASHAALLKDGVLLIAGRVGDVVTERWLGALYGAPVAMVGGEGQTRHVFIPAGARWSTNREIKGRAAW